MRLLFALTGLALATAGPGMAQDMPGMDHAQMDHSKMAPPAPAKPADPHAGHDMAGMPGMDHGVTFDEAPEPGPNLWASGTSWQPDVTPHEGVHQMAGPWMIMTHATLNGVVDSQGGPRGDDKTFLSGMAMVMAERGVGRDGDLLLRAMLSPDPLMGKRGYPLLLASGETADGVTPLIDRQHPHDLFMELSATYKYRLANGVQEFAYGGLPGEPAFGPPAFMHRLSIMDSPEAPISHHWLDSTHITFGVVTAGVTNNVWKLEASRFHGREPDEHRYDIETGALDSTAVRLAWNPTSNWSLQGSWADVKSPEQLDPDENQTKWSASAIYTRRWGDAWWSTTAAWGRRSSGHEDLDAWVLESAVKPNAAWTIFARAERTENNELTSVGGHHGPVYTVAKASIGAVRDWRLSEHVSVGLGGLYAINFVPGGLEPDYGGDPDGGMAFVRLKLN